MTVLLALALLTGAGAAVAVWAKRQLLDTPQWTATSARMLADPKVEPALARFLVAQLLTGLDLRGVVSGALPTPLRGLADPITAQLRSSADTAAIAVLATPAARTAWASANRLAHAQLVALLDGRPSSLFGSGDGTVTLDLHRLVTLLLARAGTASALGSAAAGAGVPLPGDLGVALARRLAQALPASSGRLVIVRSSQLHTAQRVVAAIRDLAVVLTVLALVLAGACVALATGWRWAALGRLGLGLLALGLLLIAARRLLGSAAIDSLVSRPSDRPAATSAWLIATTLLRDLALALAGCGLMAALVGLGGSRARGRRGEARPASIGRPMRERHGV